VNLTAYDHYAGKFYNEGIYFSEHGLYEEAGASYDKALRREPDLIHAWFNRGFALHTRICRQKE
jgi:tetratricopeptide (TPR) repeat protein